MKATQLPVIVNDATTGHKLQGSSVYNLFIHCWSSVRNWDYVMLSRVRTRNGLFLREPISKRNLDRYAVPPALQRMMDKFRQKSPNYWSDEEYSELFELDAEMDE